MKNRIKVDKGWDKLDFYLVMNGESYYLFTEKYSKGVFQYFQQERLEKEILEFRGWRKNPRLNKTIEKIPMYVRYVMKEIA